MLLRSAPGLDAIFCGNDQIARGVADAAREAGRRVPEDVALVGFDNWEVMAAACRPPLTTVDMNLRELGRTAGENLLAAIEGHPSAGLRLLPCSLVLRESSRPRPGRHAGNGGRHAGRAGAGRARARPARGPRPGRAARVISMQPAASRRRPNSAVMAASGQCAFRPLGLGTIHSRVPPITVSCGPTWASFVPNETRYAVTPAMATYRGRCRDTSSASRAPPACSSARLSSAAWAVARATRFVMPSP